MVIGRIYRAVVFRLHKLYNTLFYLFIDKRNVLFVNAYINQLGDRIRDNNIGDDLNIVLLNQLSGKRVLTYRCFYHFGRHTENIMAIGSVIEWMGNEKTTVWGAGMLEPPAEKQNVSKPLSLWRICAVRGKKTRDGLLNAGIACPEVYGDPALLMPLVYRPSVQKVKNRVGIIPHYVDIQNPNVKRLLCEFGNNGVLIPVQGYKHWQDVIDLICSCEFVFSSSLHGLILADAYGTPNQWVKFSDLLTGGSFKFEDYYSVTGRDVHPVVIDDKTEITDLLECKKLYQEYHFDPLPLLRACPFEITHSVIRQMLREYE